MASFYQHPYRNFGSTQEGQTFREQAFPQSDPAVAAQQPAQNQNAAPAAENAGGKESYLAFLFQGNNAKILLPAIFVVGSVAWVYLYDSLVAYSEGDLRQRLRGRHGEAANDSLSDEELSDRHFENPNARGNWRPPEGDGTRSVDEARSRAGFFGRLFCSGLKRSRWCD